MITNEPSASSAKTQLFAWDGFSFEVPADWNLSSYKVESKISSISMQDDSSLRLEMEWLRARKPIDGISVKHRYTKQAEPLTRADAQVTLIEELPPGWSAYLYSMPEGGHLLTAFWLTPDAHFFCFIKLHYPAASRREPVRMIRQIASEFRINNQPAAPWAVYDISFRLNRDFQLINTSFQAGRKLMVFEWRLRRLFLWFFSLADLALRTKSLNIWCADYLNAFKGIQGVHFEPAPDGGITARKSKYYPLGHIESIVRGCLRYRAFCRHIAEKNQIALCFLHYRKPSDLEHLQLELDSAINNDGQ